MRTRHVEWALARRSRARPPIVAAHVVRHNRVIEARCQPLRVLEFDTMLLSQNERVAIAQGRKARTDGTRAAVVGAPKTVPNPKRGLSLEIDLLCADWINRVPRGPVAQQKRICLPRQV